MASPKHPLKLIIIMFYDVIIKADHIINSFTWKPQPILDISI